MGNISEMADSRKIKRALISVFNKTGLESILKKLNSYDVEFISTGGTCEYIKSLGYSCIEVESLTGFPSILGGRVKTLHPAIFGGILSRRDNESDRKQTAEYSISNIDLVIVDLYPFEQTVASGASEEDIIEKIDIGGISLIRAGAKNFKDVVIVPSQKQYSLLESILTDGVETTLSQRKNFAKLAFGVSSSYDSAIFNYFDQGEKSALRLCKDGEMTLRYGENPHQAGRFYGDFDRMFDKLHGKEISYNNLLDIDAAVSLIHDFEQPTVCILKHNNACGVASAQNIFQAWTDSLACDPVSAFGGVIIANREIDKNTAEEIGKIFFEVIIAPGFTKEAFDILALKKNRIILKSKDLVIPEKRYRSALCGILEEDSDLKTEILSDLEIVTPLKPDDNMISDMLFANKIVKHSKSNAIVLAKDGKLLASGIGQTSRVDALNQAIAKAQSFGFDLKGSVMASDAFFPFPDCVEIAHKAGVTGVIHPGGSIRDNESIEFCKENGMIMAITGIRHFKH